MTRPARISKEYMGQIAAAEAPFLDFYGFVVEEMGHGFARVRLPYHAKHIRPGGTICGPAMMALADFAMWVAVMGAVGEVPLAVTTNLNCNFLTKPSQADLICEARLIKEGKRLCVGDMGIRAEGDEAMCAHVTATYSIPPQHRGTAPTNQV